MARLLPLTTSERAGSSTDPGHAREHQASKATIYRIQLDEGTGRFERC